MDAYEAEEKARKLAEYQSELEEGWKDLVKSVLSNTRLDPKYLGQKYEFFAPFEGEVTVEQVKALQQSPYGISFRHFLTLWQALPQSREKPEFHEIIELFKKLSTSTESLHRAVTYLERDKEPLAHIEILKRISFLTFHTWTDKPLFKIEDLAEALNEYIATGIEWPFVERTLLKMCIQRAHREQQFKARPVSETLAEKIFGKTSVPSAFFQVFLYIAGFFLPILVWVAVDAAIVVWSVAHLSGEKNSLWAYIGIVYVAVTVPISIIHYGTTEIRYSLKRIVDPGWDRYQPVMNPDLEAMNTAVNGYGDGHINLRLVREQISRLQTTPIKMPVQLLTLIDLGLGKGLHYWGYEQGRN